MPVQPPPGWPQQPMSVPPGYPPFYPVAVPPKKSNAGLIIGIVLGVVALLCVGGVVAAIAVNRLAGTPIAAATHTTSPGPVITTTPTSPTTPEPRATGETFNMNLGDGVKVTATNGDQWAVQVLDAHWFPNSCADLGTNPVLVVDVHFEVLQGSASLSSADNFRYVDSGGNQASYSGLTGCANPALDDTTDLTAGQSRDGQLDFEVPSGTGGVLSYVDQSVPAASWVITGP
jgi:hypothetical protein